MSVFLRKYSDFSEWKWDNNEFGIHRHSLTWHRLDDGVIVAAYRGHRVYEYHPDGSQYLIYDANSYTSVVTKRWSERLLHVHFSSRRIYRANGESLFSLSFEQLKPSQNIPRLVLCNSQTVTGFSRFKLTETDDNKLMIVGDKPPKLRVKDSAKYTQFNKKLKQLKAVLAAQIKSGVYDEIGAYPQSSYHFDPELSLRAELRKENNFSPTPYLLYSEVKTFKWEKAIEWTQTQDPKLLRSFVLSCLYTHSSNEPVGTTQNIYKRVISGITETQKHYLQKYCVTISDPTNSPSLSDESDDQNSELFPPSGLREVQVPSEAQVC